MTPPTTQPTALTLSNEGVLNSLGQLEGVQQAAAGGPFKLNIARIAAVVRAEDKLIREQIQGLQLEHVELDADGNAKPQVIGGRTIADSVIWKSKPAFDKAVQKLLAAEVTIDVLRIPTAEIESLSEFKGSIEFLIPFLA